MGKKGKGHIFLSKLGKPYTSAGFGSMFTRAIRRAGIKCTFHDLRHTFATDLVLGGVDLMTVKELLGHSSIKIHNTTNPIPKLKLLKEPPPRELIICAEEIQKLLAVSKTNRNLHDIILLAYNTGLRLSEALNLKWNDVHLDTLYLVIEGKGGKARKIPINTVLLDMFLGRK